MGKEEAPEAGEKIELTKAELSQLFSYYDEEETGSISKESFIETLCKRFMKVRKETAITTEMGVVGCKPLRKLAVAEVVEVLKGPMRDKNMKVSRILCKALKDGQEGRVSVAGNQGTQFLEDGGNLFKVIRKCVMTDAFETNGEANGDDNMLSPGTVLEVREFQRKDEASGATRMRGRARTADDKKVGWVTTLSKEGKVFCR